MMSTIRKVGLGMAIAACVGLGAGPRAVQAQTRRICGTDTSKWQSQVVTNGVQNVYVVESNSWQGNTSQQCIDYSTNGNFTVTVKGDPILGYPNILRGQAFGTSSVNSGMNFQPGNLSSLPISWQIGTTSGGSQIPGKWNASVEFWVETCDPVNNSSCKGAYDGAGGQANGTELMVWLAETPDNAVPGGLPLIGEVVIAGTLWNVVAGKWGGGSGVYWNYLAYYPAFDVQLPGIEADFKPFFVDGATRSGGGNGGCQNGSSGAGNCIYDNWYVQSVQAGFEVFSNGVGLSSSGFSANVNGAAPAPVHPALLWHNPSTGDLGAWLLDNSGTVTGTRYLSANCGFGNYCAYEWSPVKGLANTLLWHDLFTGQLSVWGFDGSGNVTSSNLNQECGWSDGCTSEWQPVGRVLEKTEGGLLWYQASTGALKYWIMNNGTVTGERFLNWSCAGCDSWRPVLTADMDGDGYSDIVWFNADSGEVNVWRLNGGTVVGNPSLSSTCSWGSGCAQDWRIIGAADVNGDGHTDLTWQNTSDGSIVSWLLDGNGNHIDNQWMSWGCGPGDGCSSAWNPLGFVTFPTR